MSWMLPLRCHARCKAALLQICHSAAFQYFRFWWPLAKEHQWTWTCQWNRTECTTEPRAKHRGGQKRKCLDGGVHQGGCSSLGLGALESCYGQGGGLEFLFRRLNKSAPTRKEIRVFTDLQQSCNSKISTFVSVAVHWKHQVVAVDSLWLCVAITLGMALVIGLAQPFAQPQMNVLQSACFACAWPCIW